MADENNFTHGSAIQCDNHFKNSLREYTIPKKQPSSFLKKSKSANKVKV
jgi:hypothetical protein